MKLEANQEACLQLQAPFRGVPKMATLFTLRDKVGIRPGGSLGVDHLEVGETSRAQEPFFAGDSDLALIGRHGSRPCYTAMSSLCLRSPPLLPAAPKLAYLGSGAALLYVRFRWMLGLRAGHFSWQSKTVLIAT